MIYLLVPIIVPILVYRFTPWCVRVLTKQEITRSWKLVLACLVYFISWYVPSPLIEGKNTSFMTHFIGGGIFSGVFWWYLKGELKWKLNGWNEVFTLYALVSTLGVTNELFEFVIMQLGIVTRINSADAWWDFVANTLGAVLFWFVYKLLLHRVK